MARRLDRPHLASQFLLRNHSAFRDALRDHTAASRRGHPPPPERIYADAEPFNIAGLCDPTKRNWYPVELRDLVENAAKLGMSAAAMEHWIEAAGWAGLCPSTD